MMRSHSTILLGLLASPQLVKAQCAACDSFAIGLQNCKNIEDRGVDGTSPAHDIGVNCICTGQIDELGACYQCSQGSPPALVAAWYGACATFYQNGPAAGLACFNTLEQDTTDYSMCAAPDDGQGSGGAGGGGSSGDGDTSFPTSTPSSNDIVTTSMAASSSSSSGAPMTSTASPPPSESQAASSSSLPPAHPTDDENSGSSPRMNIMLSIKVGKGPVALVLAFVVAVITFSM